MTEEDQVFEKFMQKTFKDMKEKVHVPERALMLETHSTHLAEKQKDVSNGALMKWVSKKSVLFAMVACLCIIIFTPYVKAAYHYWFAGPEIDQGLQQAQNRGHVQPIDLSTSDQNMKVTLQAVSADSTRTVLQVSTDGADLMEMNGLLLRDEKGKTYPMQSRTSSGQIEYAPFDADVTSAVLQVQSIRGIKGKWSIVFPVKRYAAPEIQPKLNVQTRDGYTLTVNKVVFGSTETQINLAFTAPYSPIQATLSDGSKTVSMTRAHFDSDSNTRNLYFAPLDEKHGYKLTLKLNFYQQPPFVVDIPNP